MKLLTPNSKKHNQQPEWHLVDGENKVAGRLATNVAQLILGKHRLDYANNKVAPVYVVVTNTDKIVFTGRKEEQKKYRHHTGYPGGLRERTVREQRRRDSRVLVREAVVGMLPKNSLRKHRMRHLKLYPGGEHPHAAQIK
jgi:large subunit ribosomal protein L13